VAARSRGISVTPQKRGYCDASFKRLETGSFQLPQVARDAMSVEMSPTQLALILSGIDLRLARQRKRYQRPAPEVKNQSVYS
jgi:IS66 Orf2 like protein